MFDESLRRLKEDVFVPLARLLARGGLTPTAVTLAAFAAGLGAAASAASNSLSLASFLWWVGRILDGLDGTLARLTQQQSDLGGYLDIVCDFGVYAAVPIGVVFGVAPSLTRRQSEEAYLALAILEGACFVNAAALFMLSGLLQQRDGRKRSRQMTSVEMPRGLVEGFETMIAFQLFLLFPQHAAFLMGTFAAAVVLTVLHRVRWACQVLQ